MMTRICSGCGGVGRTYDPERGSTECAVCLGTGEEKVVTLDEGLLQILEQDMEQSRARISVVTAERHAIAIARDFFRQSYGQENRDLAATLMKAYLEYDETVVQPALRALASAVDAYYAQRSILEKVNNNEAN